MVEECTGWLIEPGTLPNLGKILILNIAVDVVRDVNNQRDSDGVLYLQESMIQ